MKNSIIFFLSVVIPLVIITFVLRDSYKENTNLEELKTQYAALHISSVDHSQHKELQKEFKNAHEITETCISCHNKRGEELLSSPHFTWEREAYIEGRGITYIGKRNLLNNFCTGIFSNEPSCNRCHAGYGWADKDFDFTNQYNVDCLACHDNSGLYDKARGGSGYPTPGIDLKTIVQSVGKPKKENCGYCHFHGGGGNNVKHGDLELALLTAPRTVDVHMGVDGANLTCVDCHTAENHVMKGRYYGLSSENTNRATCEQCHTNTPHTVYKLNEHVAKIACQTCHIPRYAKVNATKMRWDWSTATKKTEGMPYEMLDSLGNPVYSSEKGDQQWAVNAIPDYLWFNGTADHHLLSDKIDFDNLPLKINTLFGSSRDKNSRIVPVKIHTGKQPYDSEYHTILQAKLWGPHPGVGALWLDFNWELALKTGMDYVGLPYSGKWDFVESQMFLPVNHMVSPSSEALTCTDCHTRNNSRLQSIEGIYIPGKSYNATIDNLGKLLIIFSFIGALSHALFRYISYKKLKANN
ncbi:MAG: tetrathionate reductase family octaheme c-type cytochrome [Bacteroidetes bacterium]|nr:tetrathionate reductase family octaheme c-type cytochrome [Bacteroidota bacterium]